jgi:hypothetical protein
MNMNFPCPLDFVRFTGDAASCAQPIAGPQTRQTATGRIFHKRASVHNFMIDGCVLDISRYMYHMM